MTTNTVESPYCQDRAGAAKDLDTAASAISEIARTCGDCLSSCADCHKLTGGGPANQPLARPTTTSLG